MTPTEIAAQITSLYAQIAALLGDDETDWDADYAALIANLAENATGLGDVLTVVAEKDFESIYWDDAREKAMDGAAQMVNANTDLNRAAEHAARHQRDTAEEIKAAADTSMHKTIQARDLQQGNLVHVGGTNYVLVANAETTARGRIAVTIYNGDIPHEKPTCFYKPGDKVSLSLRGPVV